MAKRTADKELTDRNRDQEDEAEENFFLWDGPFSLASEDVFKSRANKKAKRRQAGEEADSSGAFKGFKGFSLTPNPTGGLFGGFGNLADFSFLTSSTKDSTASVTTPCGGFSSPATNKDPVTGSLSFKGGASSFSFSKPTCGSDVTENSSASSPDIGSDLAGMSSLLTVLCSTLCDLNLIFRDYELHLASIEKKYGSGAAEQENAGAKPESGGEEKPGLQASVSTAAATPFCPSSSSSSSNEHDIQVIALNCSVRNWITKHVNDNPLCDLSPIFRDYELHLADIKKKHGSGAAEQENAGAKPESRGEEKRGLQASVSTAAATPSCSSSAGTVTPVKSTGVTFNFGQKVDNSVLGSLASAASSGFSFTTSPSSSSSSTQTAGQNWADEESEEPPVPVVKEIKDKDAFYSKK